MYDETYKVFVKAKVAVQLDEPVAYDINGNDVEINSKEQVGLPSTIRITKPSFILFADETGINTNQKKDGKVGGEKVIVPRGMVPQKLANTSDHRATVLPLISGTGEPVACVVIFEAQQEELGAVQEEKKG